MSDEAAFMLVDPFDGDGPEVFYDACNEIERLEGVVLRFRTALERIATGVVWGGDSQAIARESLVNPHTVEREAPQ